MTAPSISQIETSVLAPSFVNSVPLVTRVTKAWATLLALAATSTGLAASGATGALLALLIFVFASRGHRRVTGEAAVNVRSQRLDLKETGTLSNVDRLYCPFDEARAGSSTT